jgi:hypothetical protein
MENKPSKTQRTLNSLRRIFFEHWPLKIGAILVGILLWLLIGYLF